MPDSDGDERGILGQPVTDWLPADRDLTWLAKAINADPFAPPLLAIAASECLLLGDDAALRRAVVAAGNPVQKTL